VKLSSWHSGSRTAAHERFLRCLTGQAWQRAASIVHRTCRSHMARVLAPGLVSCWAAGLYRWKLTHGLWSQVWLAQVSVLLLQNKSKTQMSEEMACTWDIRSALWCRSQSCLNWHPKGHVQGMFQTGRPTSYLCRPGQKC
jgi:hypothetical protein